MSTRRVAAVAVAAGALAAGAVPGAQAKLQIGGFVGDEPGTGGGSFLQPTDVAVYRGDPDDGDDDRILVTEGLDRNSRVQVLDPDGNFLLAWGRDVVRADAPGDTGAGYEVCRRASACKGAPSGSGEGELDEPSGVAVDDSTGTVYVLDAGNGRVQRFSLDGRFAGAWDLAVKGSAASFADAPIAVAPAEPHDVFVGDGAAKRVLQFDSDGELQRAWGWGVATGARKFEVCTAESGCRAGRRVPGLTDRPQSWPRHLAVDADGTVYAAVFLEIIFEGRETRVQIARFRSEPSPEPPAAGDTLLTPLRPYAGLWTNEPDYSLLTDGATLGLDIAPAGGELLAITNPFGPNKLDIVEDPGSERRPRPRVHVVDGLPFLQNVTGLAALDDDVLLISSGTVEQVTGPSSFKGCADPKARRDCHGLVVLAEEGAAHALLTWTSDRTVGAVIDPHGVATYRIQASIDGRRWRDIAQPGYVMAARPRALAVRTDALPPGKLYKLRLVLTERTRRGNLVTRSPETTLLTG